MSSAINYLGSFYQNYSDRINHAAVRGALVAATGALLPTKSMTGILAPALVAATSPLDESLANTALISLGIHLFSRSEDLVLTIGSIALARLIATSTINNHSSPLKKNIQVLTQSASCFSLGALVATGLARRSSSPLVSAIVYFTAGKISNPVETPKALFAGFASQLLIEASHIANQSIETIPALTAGYSLYQECSALSLLARRLVTIHNPRRMAGETSPSLKITALALLASIVATKYFSPISHSLQTHGILACMYVGAYALKQIQASFSSSSTAGRELITQNNHQVSTSSTNTNTSTTPHRRTSSNSRRSTVQESINRGNSQTFTPSANTNTSTTPYGRTSSNSRHPTTQESIHRCNHQIFTSSAANTHTNATPYGGASGSSLHWKKTKAPIRAIIDVELIPSDKRSSRTTVANDSALPHINRTIRDWNKRNRSNNWTLNRSSFLETLNGTTRRQQEEHSTGGVRVNVRFERTGSLSRGSSTDGSSGSWYQHPYLH